VSDRKQAMRADARQALAALDAVDRAGGSERLCEALWADGGLLQGAFMPGAILMGFMPLPDEVDPTPAMRRWLDAGGRLASPVSNWEARTMQAAEVNSLDETSFLVSDHGIREPQDPVLLPSEELTLVLVPGLAFDAAGGRLGRGGGFYDRFLTGVSCPTVGVCHRCQIVPSVPADPHDRQVGCVVAV
jgi:5-formyltetrahydrofolate cyclo-ligase